MHFLYLLNYVIKTKLMRLLSFIITVLLFSSQASAQYHYFFDRSGKYYGKGRTIYTAPSFLLISPDPTGSSLGDAGVSTKPDAYSMYWNPAKYAVRDTSSIQGNSGFRVGLSITRWLPEVTDRNWIAGLFISKYISENTAVSGSARFTTDEHNYYTDINGLLVGRTSPYEYAVDLSLSHKLTDHLFGAIAGRFIYSDMFNKMNMESYGLKAGTSVAADLALFYTRNVKLSDQEAVFNAGLNISNIGTKISYRKDKKGKEFIPTNLRFGPSITMNVFTKDKLTLAVDFIKLLVPTPPVFLFDSTGAIMLDTDNKPIILDGMSNDVSVLGGMFQSFYDAPDGMKEELKEFTISFGAEYLISNTVALRAGYFNESQDKGNRKFLTVGAGLKIDAFEINASYIPKYRDYNAVILSKTWRIGLSVDL